MIYNEVVHLNADNKVLIEVLDGRSVRVTIDANPIEVEYESKKVSCIRIEGITYLSLVEFNKIFIMFNGKLHTYEITEIDRIAENVFQCHTMLRTKSSFFVTPILGGDRTFFKWNQYFVNTFISETNNYVYVLFRFFNSEDFKEFEHSITKHPLFDKLIDYDRQHVAIRFKVSADGEKIISLFKQGKYSKLPYEYKNQVLKFHNLSKDTVVGRVLFKADERKKQLELELGVTIPPDVELYDIPDSKELFRHKDDLILAV